MFKFNLGDELKDIITGFSGIVVARSEYLTGCRHYGICPTAVSKEGKVPEWEWLDETRLELKRSKSIKKKGPNGGPSFNPPEA